MGGNGAIDRVGFPESCGFGRSIEEVQEIALRLLIDHGFYRSTIASLIPSASKILGFEIVARQLAEFFR